MSQEREPATQVLTFRLGDELFALEIAKVREVLEYRNVTSLPRTPEYVTGVIDLRGHVVPVVDLHTRFGSGVTAKTADACIIIVQVEFDEGTLHVGALADAVIEVAELQAGSIEPTPRIGSQLDLDFIRGMVEQGDGLVIVLDADRVFADDAILAAGRSERGREALTAHA